MKIQITPSPSNYIPFRNCSAKCWQQPPFCVIATACTSYILMMKLIVRDETDILEFFGVMKIVNAFR